MAKNDSSRDRSAKGAGRSMLLLTALIAATAIPVAAAAASNDLLISMGYRYDPAQGPLTGDEGSLAIYQLPTFTATTQGFGATSVSSDLSNVPGAPYIGVHQLSLHQTTSAPSVPIPGGSDGLITSPGVDDFMVMHLTQNMLPFVNFVLASHPGSEAVTADFGIRISGPSGDTIVGCFTGLSGNRPCDTLGWSSVQQFGDTLSGEIELPRIDGDYTLSFGNFHLESQVVPEPATWALMIMGFGAMGTVLRRRTRAHAPLA